MNNLSGPVTRMLSVLIPGQAQDSLGVTLTPPVNVIIHLYLFPVGRQDTACRDSTRIII